jgi:hypothetical protein
MNMPAESSTNPTVRSLLTESKLSSKTITGVSVYQRGSIIIVELAATGGPFFIKIFQGRVQFGTSADWDETYTGTAPHFSV